MESTALRSKWSWRCLPAPGSASAALLIPYDSMVVEFLILFGLVGLVLALLLWLNIGASCWRIDQPLTQFARMFAALLLLASIGFSPLTANRVSVPVWIILGVIALSKPMARQPETSGLRAWPHPPTTGGSRLGESRTCQLWPEEIP